MSSLSQSTFVGLLSVFLFCALVAATFATAQSTTTGAIAGLVTDQQRAIVVGASVKAVDLGTGREVTAQSDASGRFLLSNLTPGTYSVAVTAPGFGPASVPRLIVEIGRVNSVDIPLSIGTQEAVVQVTSEAPVVQTTESDFTSNLNQVAINELPINGRRWSNFALLTPGVSPDGNFGLISFRGISGLLNNNTVDGGDNNQAFFSEERGRTRIGYVIGQASVKEFQVNLSNYSAEYGRAAGGVVNAVTKSGTNDIHGTIFYLLRHSDLAARNAFSFAFGEPIKPRDVRHQFGGAVGGPIVRDKLFFFFSYDQQKRDFPGVAAASSPTTFFAPISVQAPGANFVNGCATAANQQTTANGWTEGNTLFCRNVTQPEADQALNFLQSLTGEVARRGDQNIVFPKLDWHINPNNVLSVQYNRMRWKSPAGIQTQAIVFRGTNSFGDDLVKVDTGIARLTSTISPTVLNEFRFQYSRDFEFQLSNPPAPGEPTTGPGGRPPSVAIGSGGLTFGKPDFLERRAFPDERRVQFANTVIATRGRHTLKFGFDFNRVSDLMDNLFREGGAYSYANRANFITDYVNPTGTDRFYSNFQQGFGPPSVEFNTWDYNFFVQDSWRATSRLTVNAGLRYEYQQLPKPQNPNSAVPQTAVFPSDRNNWGPRIGLAYDLTGNGKTALRGGYGIYYGRIINSTIANAITNVGLDTGQRQFFRTNTAVDGPVYPNVFATPPAVASTPDVVFFAAGASNPLIHQMDVVLEREIAPNTVASGSFLASFGRNLPRFVDTNLNPATATSAYTVIGGPFDGQTITVPRYTGPRPNTTFGRMTEIRNNVESTYYAMVLQLNRRMRSGLQFGLGYTLARSDDDGQGSQTFTNANSVLDPFNLAVERGPTNFVVRNSFGGNVIWQPRLETDNPFFSGFLNDWTLSGILSIASGSPFSATTSGNAPGGLAGGPLGVGGANRLPFIDRNNFLMPYTANVDGRLSRRVRFTEGVTAEALIEAFNLFNRRNITGLTTQMYLIGGTTAAPTMTFSDGQSGRPVFAAPTAAGNNILRERQIQFGFRLHF